MSAFADALSPRSQAAMLAQQNRAAVQSIDTENLVEQVCVRERNECATAVRASLSQLRIGLRPAKDGSLQDVCLSLHAL